MTPEIEVTFIDVDVSDLQERLTSCGAKQIFPRTFMKRKVFDHELYEKWTYLRVRDEWARTTMTLKKVEEEGNIDGVYEHEIEVSNFDVACELLLSSGLTLKAYQETYREKRMVHNVEVVIDERPWLSPYVEIEGASPESIQRVSELLWLDFADWIFGTVALVAEKELGLSRDYVNSLSEITFEKPLQRRSAI
jgi:adenylate cyclase, class 2